MKKTLLFCSLVFAITITAHAKDNSTVNKITIADLNSLKVEDLQEDNRLSQYVFSVIESAPETMYSQKVFHAVKNTLTTSVSNYYFATTFIKMWENGGMQQVLLCDPDEIKDKKTELQKTVEAFKYYEHIEVATFIEKLIPKSELWSQEIAALYAKEDVGKVVDESEFDNIWNAVDSYDDQFEKIIADGTSIYNAIYEDIKKHPENYIKK